MSFLSSSDSGFWEKIETVSHPFPILDPGAMMKNNSFFFFFLQFFKYHKLNYS